jgi:hypothetical protein
MDLVAVKENDFAGKHPSVVSKNSKEQWKRDMHKSVFGDQSIVAHPLPFKEIKNTAQFDTRAAGVN